MDNSYEKANCLYIFCFLDLYSTAFLYTLDISIYKAFLRSLLFQPLSFLQNATLRKFYFSIPFHISFITFLLVAIFAQSIHLPLTSILSHSFPSLSSLFPPLLPMVGYLPCLSLSSLLLPLMLCSCLASLSLPTSLSINVSFNHDTICNAFFSTL